MTLEEKVKLCTAQSKFSSAGVPRLGIPEIWMSDGPHGVRQEISWATWAPANWTNDSCVAFPALTCLAASWNPEVSKVYGIAVGEEARYRKKDVLLGPGVNIYRTPMNGRNFEYMGEDPFLASKMVVPYIHGLQQNGVAACVKHYALNNQEKWRGHIEVELSDRALHEIYLPAFEAAIKEGNAWSVMGAYNKYKGQHACHNEILLNKILKKDWGFDGCVITDWGGAHDTYESAMYGLDIEMGSYTDGFTAESKYSFDDYYLAKPYLEMLKEGKVPVSTVDDKAARILRLIFRTSMDSNKPWGSFTSEEHYDAAYQIATEGITLLQNNEVKKGKGRLLPIEANKYNKILVVGDNATRRLTEGGGSSELKVEKEISPLEALRAEFGDKITYVQGYEAGQTIYDVVDFVPSETTALLKKEAIAEAKDADLILFIGGLNKNHEQDCENGDRIQYDLPFGQNELIDELSKINQNVVLVLLSGNAVELPWSNKVPAIVQGWYLGSISGNAITDVLVGKVNPSGKLPFSFPAKLTDNGAHSFDNLCYPGNRLKDVFKEDILVGYRWHDTKKIPAKFAFGHGLSYTNFKVGKVEVKNKTISKSDKIELVVPIKNTGKRFGKEVLQLYVGESKPTVIRPTKELKKFAKVSLDANEEILV